MDMGHGYWAWILGVDIGHGHAAWTCSMDVRHGRSAWMFGMDMRHGHAVYISKTCRKDIRFRIDRGMLHGHSAGNAAWK